jgi:hypothetical protein
MSVEHISDQPIILSQDSHKNPLVNLDLLEDDPWLSPLQMITLFGCSKKELILAISTVIKAYDISKKDHIRRIQHIEKSGDKSSAKTTVQYKLEIVILVALQLNTTEARQVQIWAVARLKDLLIRGASINKTRLKNRDKWKTHFLRTAQQLKDS